MVHFQHHHRDRSEDGQPHPTDLGREGPVLLEHRVEQGAQPDDEGVEGPTEQEEEKMEEVNVLGFVKGSQLLDPRSQGQSSPHPSSGVGLRKW